MTPEQVKELIQQRLLDSLNEYVEELSMREYIDAFKDPGYDWISDFLESKF